MKNSVSLVIPNWNGEKLLRKNLKPVINALPPRSEVIVVDDGSQDKSIDYIRKNFPRVKVLENKTNKGFIFSCNRGFKAASGSFVVLLNSDVIPQAHFLAKALPHFDDPEVFAVSFNERKFGWAKIWWRGGYIHHGVGEGNKDAHLSAWASGGSAVFRKSMWEELQGFDPLFHPFYWEDFDLGYRAWQRGWKIIWEPKALVDHHHEGTISRLKQDYVNLVRERNQLLFIWKNITDPFFLFSHIFGVILRIVLGPNYLKVVWAACQRFREIKPKKVTPHLRDREIIRLFR